MDHYVYFWGGIALVFILIFGVSSYFDKKRREKLSESLSRLGFSFEPGPKPPSWFSFSHLPLFQRGRNESAKNIGKLKDGNKEFVCFDYRYTSGSGKHKSTHHYAVFCLTGQFSVPEFTLSKEDMLSKIAQKLGYDDIDISGDDEFSKKFVLRGSDRESIAKVFTPDLTQFIKQHPKLILEGGRGAIIRYRSGRVSPDDLVSWIEESKQILSLFTR